MYKVRNHSSSIQTVAILTNFQEFNPGYSLTGIVVDQAHMLAREGHKVIIYVSEHYNPKWEADSGLLDLFIKYKNKISIRKLTKFMHLTDYVSMNDLTEEHKKQSVEAAQMFFTDMIENGVRFIFTHDFIFTGWNLPYSQALKNVNEKFREGNHSINWFHWVHSVPNGMKDWWFWANYGENHKIVFPNKTEVDRVANQFRTTAKNIRAIPHIKDIRNWYSFSDEVMEITEEFPMIMRSDIMQVYPCSTDRLSAKQLQIVIQIFAHIKRCTSLIPFLVIANQWATGKQRKEDVNKFIKYGEQFGLRRNQDFLFTSEIKEEYATGISKRMVRELQLLSNVFIFPTKEESFGLVGPEAAFSGALPVINRSLTMMFEVMSEHPPAYDFGSFHQNTPDVENSNYINAVAMSIVDHLLTNPITLTKNYCRLKYNMDHIYETYYMPMFNNLLDL